MQEITQAEIAETLKMFEKFSESDVQKFIRTFQKKQEPLLVYLAAVVEREELNEHEYDLLLTNVLLAWDVMRKKSSNLKKMSMELLQEIDEKPFSVTDNIQHHPQQALLEHIQKNTLDSAPEVREDRKPLILFTLKNVVDGLLQNSEVKS